MKKTLASLLIPLCATIFNGCMHNDQIRIPRSPTQVYQYNFKGKEIKAYENRFGNGHSGSFIMEIKDKNKKTVYIGHQSLEKGNYPDFIEFHKEFKMERYEVRGLPKDIKELIKKDFDFHLKNLRKQREKNLIEKLKSSQN